MYQNVNHSIIYEDKQLESENAKINYDIFILLDIKQLFNTMFSNKVVCQVEMLTTWY